MDWEYEQFLSKNVLRDLLKKHQSGAADFSEILWTATNFLIWKEQYDV